MNGSGMEVMNGGGSGDWDDWRQGETSLPALLGKFYDTKSYTDVNFRLADGSVVQAHKLLLAITSPVFEGMFFGPMSDRNLHEVAIEDVKPVGFRRLLSFIYTSRSLSWKVEDPEEWWHILEAANKYLNTRLVEQVERKLRDIAKRDAGKGVILKHLNMSNRCPFDTGLKTVFLNTVVKTTSKLIQCDQWSSLDEGAIMQIYDQEFLSATEGELYVGAKQWCLRNSLNESEALKMFLEKFASRIIPEYMSQRDFLTCVANDAFLGQVDVFRDWTIKIMVKNAEDNTIRGSYRPMRILEFYFNAHQRGSGIQFGEDTCIIDFQEETTRYRAALTTVFDGGNSGLHLSLLTESSPKFIQGNKPLTFVRPGPKSTKMNLPSLPEMLSDEEVQKNARKSALVIAKLKNGQFKAEILINLDDHGSAFSSMNFFDERKPEIEYVKVMVVIDARPIFKVNAISHKQFVEYVGTTDVSERSMLEKVNFSKEFEFRLEHYNLEAAEKEICRTLKLKDCQAWYVNNQSRCKKREVFGSDTNELAGFLRYEAINRMINKAVVDINTDRGRKCFTGKGGDELDRLVTKLTEMQDHYKSPQFWIMLEKEFKDDPDKLVSSVCKYDSASGKLSYCGTICLQMHEPAKLQPTKEFFNMILYNSDPNSKVYLRRFLNSLNVTKVSPSDDIEGIKNFDIFVIQEGAKTSDGVIVDYDNFIIQKINELQITFRSKSGVDDGGVTISLDGSQGIQYVKAKLLEALEVPDSGNVAVWECITTEAPTANPLKKRPVRKPMDTPISEAEQRPLKDWFDYCVDGSKTLYYHL